MLNLKIIKACSSRKNFLQQLSQFRDIPLTISQVIDKSFLGLPRFYIKGMIEGATG